MIGLLAGRAMPSAAARGLADLVEAGHGLGTSLEILPRAGLGSGQRGTLEEARAALDSGAPADEVLHRLGLEITASAFRGRTHRGQGIADALRADAARREHLEQDRARVLSKVVLFGGVLLVMLAVSVVFSWWVLPDRIAELTASMPANSRITPLLTEFTHQRDVWTTVVVGAAALCVSLFLLAAGALGPRVLMDTLQDQRLHVPFLRGHALHGCRARLLTALAHEQAAGIPSHLTVARVAEREPVPALRLELARCAARLEAGDPWPATLAGSRLETGGLRDLAALAGRGARPLAGRMAAARDHRDRALVALRRGMIAASVLTMVPSFVMTASFLQAVFISSTAADIEGSRINMEHMLERVDRTIQSPGRR